MPGGPWIAIVLLIIVVLVLRFVGEPEREGVPGRGEFTLCRSAFQQTCVVDGDTIRYGGEKIRLLGIDAPEVFNPKCAAEKALGEQATQRLLELMNEGPFKLVQSGERDEDRYGRKLRLVKRDGRSMGERLIAEGLARRWDGRRRSWCR